jgi:hypothetical protein
MSIRFACPRCKQVLGVATRKAGTAVTCPKCKGSIVVPAAEESASGQASSAASSVGPSLSEPADVTSRFATPDIEETLSSLVIFDTESVPPAKRSASSARTADSERTMLLIPRKVVYFQATLLALVAVLFFLAGWWIGGSRGGRAQSGDLAGFGGQATMEVLLHYQGEGDAMRPDEGAAVLVLPVNKRVTDKLSAADLAPTAPPPNAASPITGKLQLLGGVYGRTDSAGKIASLVVPEAGKHYVLLLSNRGRRAGEPRPADLATLGTYLEGAAELLADRQYRLTTEDLSGTVSMAYDFRK